MRSEEMIVATLFGGLTLLGLVGIVGGLLYRHRARLLTHQERMTALELGRDLPDDSATGRLKAIFGASSSGEPDESRSLARKCFSTALWVAFWGFVFASQGGWNHTGISIVIALSAGAIGVTATICGTILAVHGRSAASTAAHSKGLIDSDAFDVVSRRG
jgi:hypothetical protein